jgi:hypothetical protein
MLHTAPSAVRPDAAASSVADQRFCRAACTDHGPSVALAPPHAGTSRRVPHPRSAARPSRSSSCAAATQPPRRVATRGHTSAIAVAAPPFLLPPTGPLARLPGPRTRCRGPPAVPVLHPHTTFSPFRLPLPSGRAAPLILALIRETPHLAGPPAADAVACPHFPVIAGPQAGGLLPRPAHLPSLGLSPAGRMPLPRVHRGHAGMLPSPFLSLPSCAPRVLPSFACS